MRQFFRPLGKGGGLRFCSILVARTALKLKRICCSDPQRPSLESVWLAASSRFFGIIQSPVHLQFFLRQGSLLRSHEL